MIRIAAPTLMLIAVSLTGCKLEGGEFPSLAKRPFENAEQAAQPTPAVPLSSALPAALQQQTNALLARSARAQAAFDRRAPAARSAATSARGSAMGGETWVNAQMLVSRADAARADGVAALSEIDGLIAAERNKGADAGLLALLARPQSAIAAQVEGQNAEIEKLSQLIGL